MGAIMDCDAGYVCSFSCCIIVQCSAGFGLVFVLRCVCMRACIWCKAWCGVRGVMSALSCTNKRWTGGCVIGLYLCVSLQVPATILVL